MEWILTTAALVVGVAAVAFVVGDRGRRWRRRADAGPASEPHGVAISGTATDDARLRAAEARERAEAALDQRRAEASAREDRLTGREATLEQRAANLAQREERLVDREAELDVRRQAIVRLEDEARTALERVSGLDAKAARDALLAKVEDEAKRQASVLVRDVETKTREEADRRARRILATAVQRLAVDVVTQASVSVVSLPTDEMKGRIIGRDGRNIRTFEAVTGVNLVVDDTPEAVSVSTFDPVRREVARIALVRLVEDGRIHPASIEESYEKAKAEVEQTMADAGEWALLEVGISRMHPELIGLLGRLRFRTSYGQNVLNHLVESAHIAGMLASELGVDPTEATRAAFLHDIGKAVSHEVGGSHALVGAEIARRFGEDASVVHGIEAHHNEVEPRTLTAVLVQAADTVSAARPGARREALEGYVRRLEKLEKIAGGFVGVDRVYAMQAGREVRVVVDPGTVDDLAANQLARQIARRLEDELQYPGEIEVTVVREFRATDYAR
ncbi:MAG: ribonuclease Y [Acidimicrobiia bacterium]|nr:ribonuclease Y [Acidimicrobiia bacterium]